MENKAKIDPKRFEIIRAYQKGEKIPGITAKFSHISKATIYRWINEFKKVESAVKQENQLKRKRRFTRLQ